MQTKPKPDNYNTDLFTLIKYNIFKIEVYIKPNI